MGKKQPKRFAPKGTSSIHGRTKTDIGSNELNIFRQHTLTKVGGCNGRNERGAVLPLGWAGSKGVVVFVHQR